MKVLFPIHTNFDLNKKLRNDEKFENDFEKQSEILKYFPDN